MTDLNLMMRSSSLKNRGEVNFVMMIIPDIAVSQQPNSASSIDHDIILDGDLVNPWTGRIDIARERFAVARPLNALLKH